jgi:hypothetical protein
MHKLLIKTHNDTGLKYLCYTKKKNHDSYKGSGKYWLRHLKTHGNNITTELILETEDYDEFRKVAVQKSVELNIVESNEWANLRIEDGDGGDTVSNKRWITNGVTDKYALITEDLPAGWRLGRSKCVFNDPKKQAEFASRIDPKKRGMSIKAAWDSGKFDKRDHSKCGNSGDENVAKRPEVKEKIRQAALKTSDVRSERAKKTKFWEKSSRGHIKNI